MSYETNHERALIGLDLTRKAVEELIILAKESLLYHFGLMKKAIFQIQFIEDNKIETIASDGKRVYYNTEKLLSLFMMDSMYLDKALIHIFVHCILVQPFQGTDERNRQIWDLATDVCVENVMIKSGISSISEQGYQTRYSFLKFLNNKKVLLDAASIYDYLINHPIPDTDVLLSAFRRDDHFFWYMFNGKSDESFNVNSNIIPYQFHAERNQIMKFWKNASEEFYSNLSRYDGDYRAIKQLCELKERRGVVSKEKVLDYQSFLRIFSSLKEIVRQNHDEFDYVFYTYGLRLYDNMPLIEPLEYKHDYKVKDFVLAIDTSGSTLFSEVNSFIRETYQILTQAMGSSKRVKIQILQCDETVVDVKVVNTMEDIELYINDLRIKGGRGTDFRPVFKYVNQYLEKSKAVDFGGVIYFTDGFGIFPEKPAKFPTVFVIPQNLSSFIKVPEWAIRFDYSKST